MKKTILAIALAFAATSAMAVDLNVTVGVGHARLAGDGSTALKLGISHDYNKYLSAEASYLYAGEHRSATTGAFDVAALGHYPLTDKVELTGRLGLSRTFARDAGNTDLAWSPVLGAGAEYKVTDRLQAHLGVDQYRNFAGTGAHLNVAMVGGVYRF